MNLRGPAKALMIAFFMAMPAVCATLAAEPASRPLAYDFKLPYLIKDGGIQLSTVLPERQFTVLIFFNSKCDACLLTVEKLGRAPEEFSEMGFSARMIAVNNDTENLNRVRAFVKTADLMFPVLSDRTGRVALAYGCDDYSFSSFVIDKTGRILDTHYDKRDDMLDYLIQVLIRLSTSK